MIYNSVADLFAMIERVQERFVASVADLKEAQENFREAPDRWTIAEISEHVSIVNTGFLKLAHRLLKEAEADPKPPIPELGISVESLAEKGNLEGKWKAPERVVPQGGVRITESMAMNRRAIDGVLVLKPRFEAIDLSGPTWDHPFLGPVNLYQTLLLFGVHQERHRNQVEVIKTCSDFPA